MARYEIIKVAPHPAGQTKDERLGGQYSTYHPDLLVHSSQVPDAPTLELVTDVTAQIAYLSGSVAHTNHLALFALLLASESIASSNIEGYQATPREVAIAHTHLGSSAASQIARNLDSMREVFTTVVRAPELTHEHLHLLHRTLMPTLHQAHPGYRRAPNWVSGRSITRAKYVPPPPETVPALMNDLLDYANTGGESAMVKAAIVHAQFETIHPYIDGNGRVGRALAHAVLCRAGLIDGPLVPFSAVWRTQESAYIQSLTNYRYPLARPTDGVAQRSQAVSQWVQFFARSCLDALDVARAMHEQTELVLGRWHQALGRHRRDAIVHRVLDLLPQSPVITTAQIAAATGASKAAAAAALNHLVAAAIVQPLGGRYRRFQLYSAEALLDLIALSQRRLGSQDFDTLISAPTVPTPALSPTQREQLVACGHVLPRSGMPCTLRKGHLGQHRHRPTPPA